MGSVFEKTPTNPELQASNPLPLALAQPKFQSFYQTNCAKALPALDWGASTIESCYHFPTYYTSLPLSFVDSRTTFWFHCYCLICRSGTGARRKTRNEARMASPAQAMRAFSKAGQWSPSCGRIVASRAMSTASSRASMLQSAARPTVAMRLANSGRIAFRRAYADEAPKPKPGKLRRTLRWTWRITYLSVGGLVAYTFYTVYQDRHPDEQYQPDPTKKTLVILGELSMFAAVMRVKNTSMGKKNH